MQTTEEWTEIGDGWQFGDAKAEDQSDAFVISTFGSDPDVGSAATAIVAAMRFNKMIVIPRTEATESIVDQLVDADRIKVAPYVGLDCEAVGIVGVKPN